MSKPSLIALVSLAICIASLSFAYADGEENIFFVEGKVYCDTCRVEFETKISEPIEGATVNLACRNRTTGIISYSQEGKTDDLGKYEITVKGDHEEDICEVEVVKSPRQNCNEFMPSWKKARVIITHKSGVADPVRFANSLGFLKDEALPECPKVLQEMGFIPLN